MILLGVKLSFDKMAVSARTRPGSLFYAEKINCYNG